MICTVVPVVIPNVEHGRVRLIIEKFSEFFDFLTYYSGLDVRFILKAVLICGSFYLIYKLIRTSFYF